jgi:hypothetical protein
MIAHPITARRFLKTGRDLRRWLPVAISAANFIPNRIKGYFIVFVLPNLEDYTLAGMWCAWIVRFVLI